MTKTNINGALVRAMDALEAATAVLPHHGKINAMAHHTIDQALADLDALTDAVPTVDILMAVHGGKDTQEARNIKHEACKIILRAMSED